MDALLEALAAAEVGLEVTEENMLEAAYHAQNDIEKLDEALDQENRE
jgi:hypothetical protein